MVALATASAVAAAEPAPGQIAATDQANAATTAAERRVDALVAQRGPLVQRYQAQLAAVDQLKNEKASWRRDRELRTSMADSADTAGQLAALDKQLAAARGALVAARQALSTAVDAELAARPIGPRAQLLGRLHAQLATQRHVVKKIVIPDAEIDPLADPEELEQQAAALRQSEQELATQVAGLDEQAKELAEVADLRKQHDRANDLALRDDDEPHRNAQHSSGSTIDGAASPSPGQGAGSGASGGTDAFNGDHGASSAAAFESEATIVLGDVLDHATIEGLARASKSGDPAQRAEAARKARDAVKARLDQLQKKRAAIEARVKALQQQ